MKLRSLDDRIAILEECDDQLADHPPDEVIKAIRARQGGIRIAGEICDKIELLAQVEALERTNQELAERLAVYAADVVRSNDSLSFGDDESQESN